MLSCNFQELTFLFLFLSCFFFALFTSFSVIVCSFNGIYSFTEAFLTSDSKVFLTGQMVGSIFIVGFIKFTLQELICCLILGIIWDKVFKSGPSKICGRYPLKILKGYCLLKQTISLQIFKRLSSTNFTWSIPICSLAKIIFR